MQLTQSAFGDVRIFAILFKFLLGFSVLFRDVTEI